MHEVLAKPGLGFQGCHWYALLLATRHLATSIVSATRVGEWWIIDISEAF